MVASNVDKLDYRNYVTLSTPVMSLPKSQIISQNLIKKTLKKTTLVLDWMFQAI